MPKLLVLSGAKLIKALEKDGFVQVRQKGDHVSLHKDAYRTVVPLHDELATGTLSNILRQCGLTRPDLERLLNE